MNKLAGVLARILLAQIFLVSIIIQLAIITKNPEGYEAYRAYLGHFGLVGIFAPLMILIQLLAGTALLLGYKTRIFAFVLAAYALFVAFALKLDEPIIFMQYLAIAGGMLMLAINHKTAWSLDGLFNKP
ncbi:MAG: DoxX family membrane protein [Methylophilaceae bacterium]|nr:DoxX family membrane protein [Methylophilaceae bacterium]